MASGTGGWLGSLQSETFEIPGNSQRVLTFATEVKDGLLVFSAGQANKRGLYIFGSATSGALSVTTVLAASGVTLTASGQTITIANGQYAAFVCVMQFKGSLPTLTTPT